MTSQGSREGHEELKVTVLFHRFKVYKTSQGLGVTGRSREGHGDFKVTVLFHRFKGAGAFVLKTSQRSQEGYKRSQRFEGHNILLQVKGRLCSWMIDK